VCGPIMGSPHVALIATQRKASSFEFSQYEMGGHISQPANLPNLASITKSSPDQSNGATAFSIWFIVTFVAFPFQGESAYLHDPLSPRTDGRMATARMSLAKGLEFCTVEVIA
jgi:hypothetical protein